MTTNHERIWLESVEGYFGGEDRTWCQDDVWGDGVEYVRADLLSEREAAKDAEIARLRDALENLIEQADIAMRAEGGEGYWAVDEARAAITALRQ